LVTLSGTSSRCNCRALLLVPWPWPKYCHCDSVNSYQSLFVCLFDILILSGEIWLQFLFAPIFIGVLLSSLVTLEGRLSQAVPKLKQVTLTHLFNLYLLIKCYNQWCFVVMFNSAYSSRNFISQEWFSAVLANWQLWIPFQFINFRFVPQHFQVRLSDRRLYMQNWKFDLTICPYA
jgi:hypothetical protein